MPKQINVKLGFQADTAQAKKQIQDLQHSLDNLMNNSIKNSATSGFDRQISNAQQSVLKLKTALNNSLNMDTGRLDLSKFNQQLNNSDLSLSKLAKDMTVMGADGQKAFLNLANSIVTAQKPMAESNRLLDSMWTALKNTARWQLSSSILHGFIGSLQGAYGYAKDLDKSLNSIRIVSGQSAEQMAQFAEQANKSAQALSTSTLAYTDAALIFYQQGLRGEEVNERVDTVLKLSNVTGESAEDVSSYMTAIWNNFDDGSISLEQYADKITALGAATASSSAEIANGMQQFAAVAKTVGLSYDYAASALATVVAQTRQSESTVGNAFRTIFSRLENVKLGETLEDGVSLTKYTEALEKVGVQVLDQNGQLKDMDNILSAIGDKWQQLNKTQQIALAQTVGGVRQYANLIALFDNWDQFQENLAVSQGAEGTLQEQADIYAESWEAARKRVQAAWQAIYQDLIDDKFFIGLLNSIEKVLSGVDTLIDSLGGLPGVLSAIGVVITSVFNNQLVNALQNAQQQFRVFSGTAEAESNAMALWVKNNLDAFKSDDNVLDSTTLSVNLTKQRLGLTIQLRDVYDKLNDAQKQHAEGLLLSLERQQQLTLETKRTSEAAQEQANDAMRNLRSSAVLKGNNQALTNYLSSEKLTKGIKELNQLERETDAWQTQYDKVLNEFKDAVKPVGEQQEKLIMKALSALVKATEAEKEYQNAKQTTQKEVSLFGKRLQELVEGYNKGIISTKELVAAIEEEQQKLIDEQGEIAKTTEEYKKLEEQKEKLQQSNQGIFSPAFAQNAINSFRGVSQLTMGLNSLSTAWNTIKNPDISDWQKFTSVITSLSFGLPALVRGFQSLGGIKTILSGLNNILNVFTIGTTVKAAIAQKELALSTAEATLAIMNETKQVAIGNLVLEGYDINTAENIVNTTILAQEKEVLAAKEALLTEEIGKGTTAALINKAALWEIYLVIGLIVAAIALWNKEEKNKIEQLKEQKQAIDDAKESAKELVKSYDELKNKLDSLSNGKKSLEELKKGTDEWKAKVRELNAEMLSLIQTYGLIEGKHFNFGEGGLIELTEAGQQEMTRQASDKARVGQVTNTAAILSDGKPQQQGDIYEISKIIGASLKDTQSTLKDYQNFSNKEFLSELGAFLKTQNNADRNFADNVKNYFEEAGISEDFANLVISNDELRAAAMDLASSINSNTAAQEAAIKSDVYDKFEGISNGAADYVAGQVQNAYNKNYESINVTEEDRQSYANAQGWSKDVEGNWVDAGGNIKSITDEMVKGYMALNAAYEEVYNNVESHIADIESDLENFQRKDITNKIVNNEAGNDQGETEKWVNSLDQDKLKILAELDIDYDDSLDKIKSKLEEELNKEPVEFDTSGLTKKQAEEAKEEFAQLTDYIQKNAKAIDELDDHLANCKREASQVAKAIMRFDDAIQDVTENYDDWSNALKTGSMQEAAKAATQMAKAYGNLLDIDGGQLSSQFLENADNLDLMKQAIEGNEDAYNQLQALMGQDILAQVGIDKTQYEIDKANIISDIEVFTGQDWGKIEIGADLNNQDFLDKLSDMVTQAGMSADQATAYLASMGIDAEVTEVPAETTTVKSQRQYWQPATYHTETESTGGEENPGVYKKLVLDDPGRWVPVDETHDEQATPTAFSLKVTSAHKSSGGGFKFKNASTGGGGKSPSGGSGKKGGGGGGGSAKKKEVKEHVKDEDRYHDIKERIDDLNKATDRLGKTKDRVYGKSKLKYINDEIEALEKQVKLTDEYIAEIKKYLALDLGNLKGIGMGAVFDENGMLTNYEQVLANITATYNKAIDEYNASAQEEADKEILEKAQKTYEENKKILKQYEDTYNLLQEEIDKRIDQINAIYDAKLAKIDWQIKLQLDFDDKDRELLQWIFDNMGEGADRAADRIANLNKQMETFDQDWETYRNGIKEIFSQHGIDLDFDNLNSDELVLKLQEYMRNEQLASELTEKEAEQLREYLSGLMTTYTSMRDTANEVHEILTNTISAMAEEFEKGNEKIEQAGNIMKHYASIVDLTGKKLLKLSSSELKKMSQQIVNNAKDALGAAKAEMEEWRAQMEEAQMLMLKYQLEGDEQSYEYWKEHFEQLEELYTDATENYYSAWENALEAANDAFEKSIDLMKEDYENAFGSMDLTWMAEQFETQQELNELYLPDYKKYHELNASVRKLNKSLQDTNNTLIKGKMNDLLDEINAKMAAGVKISEYEAGIIERRIALLQAEAQLRDAQQAKSAVRMTRDNEGNFSYTYTADQDAIGDAEENYAEAVYDYQDYMVSMSNDLQSKWLEWNQYFADREAEILTKYKEGTEEYNQAMAALAEERAAKLGWLTDQMGVLFDEQKRFRDNDWADIENIVQMKLLSDEDLITSFDRTVLSAITGYDTLTELMDAGEMAWENMLVDAENALQTWQDNCYTIYEEAGTTVDDFAAKTEADMNKVSEDSQKAKEAIYDMVNNEENGMKKALEDAKTAAKDFDDAYGKYMTNIRNATQNTIAALNDMLKKLNETYQAQVKLAQQAEATAAAVAAANNAAAGSGSGGSGSGGSGSGGTGSNLGGSVNNKGGHAAVITYRYYLTSTRAWYSTKGEATSKGSLYGGDLYEYKYTDGALTSSKKIASFGSSTISSSTGGSSGSGRVGNRNVMMTMSTGGYTGDWVTDVGRLAVLHKKELVLNKDDTANMLKTVDLVREMMTQTIGTQSLFRNNINYTGVNTIGAMSRELQQSVHIDASFPNVQSHTEIELALNNLINSATQYVNRK